LWHWNLEPTVGWTVDFGAGNGGFWAATGRPKQLVLVDIVDDFTNATPGPWVIADARLPPFAPGSVGCIVALGLSEYIDDLEELLARWRGIVRTGSGLLLSNSPPVIPNLLRWVCGLGARPRRDSAVISALERTGWKRLTPSPLHKGWQTIFAARAV